MRYLIKQKVFTLKDKFSIIDEQENVLFNVEGKFFSISNKLSLFNPIGDEILKAQKKLFRFLPKYTISLPNGEEVATVQKRFSIRPNFTVMYGPDQIEVKGNFIGHKFTMYKNGVEVVNVSKKLFSFGDTYMIDVLDEHQPEIYLFIVVVIDQIIEEAEAKRNAGD
jgi:uncharacterized protein YxjI